MNIVVLAGGLSTERDVSLNTGTMVSKALRSKGHNVIMLDVFMGYHEEEEDITDIFNHTEAAVIWEVPLPWIKEFQKKCLRQLVFRHRTVLQ